MNEAKLIEKLRLIEALYAGGTERAAAAHARLLHLPNVLLAGP